MQLIIIQQLKERSYQAIKRHTWNLNACRLLKEVSLPRLHAACYRMNVSVQISYIKTYSSVMVFGDGAYGR